MTVTLIFNINNLVILALSIRDLSINRRESKSVIISIRLRTLEI